MKASSALWLWMVCAMLLGFGCQRGPSDFVSYRQWFAEDENGYLKSKTIDDLRFAVQYRPVDLMLLSELQEDSSYTPDVLASLRKEYEGSRYFMFEIGLDEKAGSNPLTKGGASYTTYKDRMMALAFGMEQRASLVVDGDTFPPVLAHMEQGYELGQRQRVILAFASPKTNAQAMTFIFKDDIFHTYQHKFLFEVSDDNLPRIPVHLTEA